VICSTWYRLLLYDSPSQNAFAAGSAVSASARSAGTSTSRVPVSSTTSTSSTWPAPTPAPVRFAALTPSQYSPPIRAIDVRH